MWVAGVLCTLWAALATVALLYPGFGTSDPDSSLPDGWAGQRGAYELSQFIPLLVLIGLGFLFYVLGAPDAPPAGGDPDLRDARRTPWCRLTRCRYCSRHGTRMA